MSNQDDNLTAKTMIRFSEKDMRNLKYLAEKECLSVATLARKIILMHMRNEVLDNE